MRIAISKEEFPGEHRVAVVPKNVKKFVEKGCTLVVEKGLGGGSHFADGDYQDAGAVVVDAKEALLKDADVILRVRKPSVQEVALYKEGAVLICYLDPFNEVELLNALKDHRVNAFSVEMIPRTTLAQKMDALSSQASLGGYVAVILAAERSDKIFPMMMTPAGTISPSHVFIIGAGVAGLQAIATAKRLGARVEAFDTRPVVENDVKSLGARFLKIDLGETGQTKDGYAKALTEEQVEKQRQGMAKACAKADVVITTAQVFGRKAPVIITKDMIAQMKPGSLIVDMAVETGGNVEGSVLGEEVVVDGVRIIGMGNLPGNVSVNASEMYSNNLTNFVEEFWDEEKKELVIDRENEIIQGSLLTHQGEIVHETVKERMSAHG